MDARRFDALSRALGAAQTRRGALAMLGALGWTAASAFRAEARKNDRNRKRRKARRRQRARPEAAACCSTGNCTPGKGKNLTECCYQGQDLSGANFKGANLGRANLSGAILTNTTFKGANLDKACLVDTDLRPAGITASTNTGGAIYCRTQTDDGENNSGCSQGTPCCPTCNDDHPCAGGEFCCGGRCVAGNCCVNTDCGSGGICRKAVCCATDLAAAVAAATSGATIRLCAGRFRAVNVSISKNLTIIGAGQGDDPASNTILDAEGAGRVLAIASAGADVELRDLRVTGGTASEGGGISNFGTLRLVGVTVMSNVTSTSGGGIRNLGFGTLTIGDGSRVEANETAGVGGGISSVGANATVTLEPGSRVTGNTADVRGGGIYNDSGTATLEAGSLVTGNTAGTGGGVHEASGTVDVADDTIVTSNTPNNCRPVGAVPNCID